MLFPARPCHTLLKEDILQSEERNNPFNDAVKAQRFLDDAIAAFYELDPGFSCILFHLLFQQKSFGFFFRIIDYKPSKDPEDPALVRCHFEGRICSRFDLDYALATKHIPLPYALALLKVNDRYSITPP